MPIPLSKNESELLALQRALDSYFESRSAAADSILKNHLNLKECIELQRRHLLKDLFLNPLNTIWAIPYFSVRKIIETSEKLGWHIGHTVLSKIPQSLKTNFQKEIETLINSKLFNLRTDQFNHCQLTTILANETALKASMTDSEFEAFLILAEQQVRMSVSEFCSKQNAFTDLASSAAILIFSHLMFRDTSLDFFKLSRKIASLWSKNQATSHFIFGKKLGEAFYSIAPPPAPTTLQIVLITAAGIGLLALVSTVAAVCIYPLQKVVGFQKKQLEILVQTTSDKVFLVLSKQLKEKTKTKQSA